METNELTTLDPEIRSNVPATDHQTGETATAEKGPLTHAYVASLAPEAIKSSKELKLTDFTSFPTEEQVKIANDVALWRNVKSNTSIGGKIRRNAEIHSSITNKAFEPAKRLEDRKVTENDVISFIDESINERKDDEFLARMETRIANGREALRLDEYVVFIRQAINNYCMTVDEAKDVLRRKSLPDSDAAKVIAKATESAN